MSKHHHKVYRSSSNNPATIHSSWDAIPTTAIAGTTDWRQARGLRELDAGGGILKMLHSRKEHVLVQASRELDYQTALREAEELLKLL